MNNSFDFDSKKYILLLILICVIFTVVIIKAFDYLPEKIDIIDDNNNVVDVNSQVDNENVLQSNDSENAVKNTIKPEQKHGVLYKSPDSLSEEQIFDEVQAPAGSLEETSTEETQTNSDITLSPEEKALKAIINARRNMKNNDVANALNEYRKVSDLTSDNELLAESYDGISELYVKSGKYGTALTFAGKAYSTSPSMSREFSIAKIYYLAGKNDIAVKRINNMLNRNYSQNH